MKKNRLMLISLIIAVLFVAIGCTAQPDNLDRTQTRIGVNDNNRVLTRNNRTDVDLNDNMGNIRDDTLGREDAIERNKLRNNIANNRLNNNNFNNNMDTDLNNNRNNNVALARKIADRVEDIEGVNRAYVLISGDMAIVGVDMDSNLEGQVTNALKQRIERAVKKVDNNIVNVGVTADPDLLTRIRNMFKDMDDGNPIEGFVDEFQEIFRRITPAR
ncbi:MAG TPA: YhcN/YlaJ family sporulation lipoprotein [Tissierellia bacterium]|nr:YhcN/YlaJ family sporulation lipoprotein [Tissierellia bacterium]